MYDDNDDAHVFNKLIINSCFLIWCLFCCFLVTENAGFYDFIFHFHVAHTARLWYFSSSFNNRHKFTSDSWIWYFIPFLIHESHVCMPSNEHSLFCSKWGETLKIAPVNIAITLHIICNDDDVICYRGKFSHSRKIKFIVQFLLIESINSVGEGKTHQWYWKHFYTDV